MPTQRKSSVEGESRPQRHRSMTGELASIVSGNRQTQERVTARATQVQKEVEQSVGPYGKALLRLRDAIVLAQTGGKETISSPTVPQVRTRAVTQIVTGEGEHGQQTYRTREASSETPELILFFVGDNSGSMSSAMGRSGLLNLDDSNTFAKAEERLIGLNSQASKEFSQNSQIPFRTQTILYGLPEQVAISDPENPYKNTVISVTNRDTGASIKRQDVVAKAVTQLGNYTQMDEQSVLTMQGSDNFRGGPTLLAPALELVLNELEANGISSDQFNGGRKAGVVFVASDFALHDSEEAKAVVQKLRNMGVRVVGLGVEGDYTNSETHRNMERVLNYDGKNHGKFCHSPEEVVAFVNDQATLEDTASGIDTNAPVVTMQSARRTRAQTQERQGSRYTGE